MNIPKEDRYLISILFILALIIRLMVYIEGGNYPGDGAYRIILTMNWLKDPYFITGGLWPPLHFYLMAFTMKIYNDPFTSTRLVSLIFGTFIVFPYYYLVKLLFDKRVAIISTLILTFLSIHVQYSTFSMSEVPFIFFLFTSIYFFFRFKRQIDNKLSNLIVSAIFLNFASMIRYEGWLFIPLLAALTLDVEEIKNRRLNKYFTTFLFASMIFPVFWLIGNYNLYGDFFYGQNWSDNYIRTNAILYPDSTYHNPPIIKRLITWPWTISYFLNIASIFVVIGLLVSILKKKNLEFLSIFLILMSIFTYKTFNLTMTLQSRQMIMPILFIIPYFVTGLDYALNRLNSLNILKFKSSNKITIIILIFFVATSSYMAMKNPSVIPDYIFDVSIWLNTNVKSNDTVMLDEYNWWSLYILTFGKFNTTFTEDYLNTHEFVTDQIRIVPGGGKKVDDATVIGYLENKPTYLVYFHKGKLSNILNFSTECKNETRFDYLFECVYGAENYNIYKQYKVYD